MKQIHIKMICLVTLALLLASPLTLLAWGFLLPAQYGVTFLGELPEKCAFLEQAESPRIVVVGGSATAFGVDSGLLEQEFPGYTAVNFGLYGGLGTEIMLELSKDSIRAGDLVILMPEQERQSLSSYFNGAFTWQALDGHFALLSRLDQAHWGALAGSFPEFAGAKMGYFLSGSAPQPDGVYARDSFDARGDITSDLCGHNIMPEGYDPNTPIRFTDDVFSGDFVNAVNAWADSLQKRGATVWFHFSPMNTLALEAGSDLDGYYDLLQSRLHIQILGNPHDSVLDSGWFFDTNFHLNQSGRTVFTRQLIRDIKAVLGDSTPTDIALPPMPTVPAAVPLTGDNADESCFTYESLDDGWKVTGLTECARGRETLTIPTQREDRPVRSLGAFTFSGCGSLREIIIPSSVVLIENNAFANCENLEHIVLRHTDPASCRVGQDLLAGTEAGIVVSADVLADFRTNYFWAAYSDRITAYPSEVY